MPHLPWGHDTWDEDHAVLQRPSHVWSLSQQAEDQALSNLQDGNDWKKPRHGELLEDPLLRPERKLNNQRNHCQKFLVTRMIIFWSSIKCSRLKLNLCTFVFCLYFQICWPTQLLGWQTIIEKDPGVQTNADPNKVGETLYCLLDHSIIANDSLNWVLNIIQLAFNSPDAPLCGI